MDGLMSKLFCAAVYQKSLGLLMGESTAPLAHTLRSQLDNLRVRESVLKQECDALRKQLSPSQVDKATKMISERLPAARSANSAFQSEGEVAAPRLDALKFARVGCHLIRRGSIRNTHMIFRVYRDYPDLYPPSPPSATPKSSHWEE
ncbi:unnamed protein product, partial [Choristocarpus tenellus]